MFLGSYRRSSLNLDSVSLLAHEKIEKSEVCQRKASPRIFLRRYVIFKPTENAKESRETGTQKEDSQCRNDPNERRYQDQKTFRLVAALEAHRQHPLPEWIPFQEV